MPDMQTKTAQPIHAPAPLKDIAPQMTTGQAVVLVSTFVVPTLFFMIFEYQLYYFAVLHTLALVVAGLLTPVCIYWMLKHRSKVKEKYFVPRMRGG
ncbi:MAG: hypothetical protein ACOVOD_02420, partial [Rhodoferax sp.]